MPDHKTVNNRERIPSDKNNHKTCNFAKQSTKPKPKKLS